MIDHIMFRNKIKAIMPDVLHAHHTGEYAWIALNEPVPAVITVHGLYGAVATSLNSKLLSHYGFLSSTAVFFLVMLVLLIQKFSSF